MIEGDLNSKESSNRVNSTLGSKGKARGAHHSMEVPPYIESLLFLSSIYCSH